MIDLLTASESNPWIISVGIPGGDPDYEHMHEIIEQLDAINLGLA
jgi:hypothetical protein